jgi:monovalent cation:H+ antiporter-2, CPA2 family
VEPPVYLTELTLIAVLGVVVTVALARLRIPSIAGLLVAGAVLGPFGLGAVEDVQVIESLAEVGVVLLLFTIGLELSLSRLRHIFRTVAVGAFLQVGLTAAAATGVALAFGEPAARAVLYGFVLAQSSTAIVLRTLAERRELDAPHGRFIVGTQVFQDLCGVPMVLILPLLAPGGGEAHVAAAAIGLAFAKAALIVLGAVLASRHLVPRLLGWVVASGSREVFVLAVVAVCIGTAWLTSQAGLSLAFGAFLGGLVVADTQFGQRAMGDVLPLRDVFVSAFFVSIGMLFDPRVVLEQPATVALLLVGFVVGKGVLATIAAMAMRFPARVAWLAGVGLGQFGELGFVLLQIGVVVGLADRAAVEPLLAAGILSMIVAPALVHLAPRFTAGERLLRPLERRIGVRSIDEADEQGPPLTGHVVIVGFGVAGRMIAAALASADIRYVAVDLDAELVRGARDAAHPVFYADATSAEALGHAGLPAARALVVVINDPQATLRVLELSRRLAPAVPVLTRSRYLASAGDLERAGAGEVVALEVEGGVKMVERLLRRLEVPEDELGAPIDAACAAIHAPVRRRPA